MQDSPDVPPQKPQIYIASGKKVQIASGLFFVKQKAPTIMNLDGFVVPIFLADDFEEGEGEVEVTEMELYPDQSYSGLEILSAPDSPDLDYLENRLLFPLDPEDPDSAGVAFEFELTVSLVSPDPEPVVRVEFVVSIEGD